MTTTYQNLKGKQRTIDELREEYNTLARLLGQKALAFDAGHPSLRQTERDLDAARDALRRAEASEAETLICLDGPEECSGAVEYRMPLSGTGRAFPRCDAHWEKRLDAQEEIDRKYGPDSDVPPRGFDPTYAGERWDDEY